MELHKRKSGYALLLFRMRTLLYLLGITLTVMVLTFLYSTFKQNPLDKLGRTDIQLSESLSSEQVKAFCETGDGYFWIGTESGLNRYDGSNYLQFRANNDTTSLVNNNIMSLLGSRFHPGRLLVSTYNGSCVYFSDGYFLSLPPMEGQINYLMEMNADTLFAYSGKNLAFFNVDSLRHSCDKIQEINCSATIRNAIVGEDHSLWILTSTEALHYNLKLERIGQKPFSKSYTQVLNVGKGKAWLYDGKEYEEMDLKTAEIYSNDRTQFVNAELAKKSNPTRLYSNGLLALKDKDQQYVLIDIDKKKIQTQEFEKLNHSEIRNIYQDHAGNIWVGSRGFGLQTQFVNHELFTGNDALCKFFDRKDITLLYPSSHGRLWVVTGRQNLFCYEHGTVTPVDFSEVGDGTIYHLTEQSNGHLLLIGTGSLLECSVQGNRLQVLQRYDRPDNAYSVIEDRNGTVWIGADAGAYVLNRQTQQLELKVSQIKRVNVIRQLRNGKLLMGSFENGVCLYDPHSGSSKLYKLPTVKRGLYSCRDLTEDREGRIWIATLGAGITRLDLQTGETQVFQSPLLNSDVSCILADRQSEEIWMGTLYGLTRFMPSTQQFYTFYEQDGVRGNEFFEKCAVYGADSTLIFGGKKGITAFNPRHIQPRPSQNLKISSVVVDQKAIIIGKTELTPDGLQDGATLNLPTMHQSLQVNFSTLDLSANVRSLVLYKLDGADWLYAANQRAFFSRLSSGMHRLYVKTLDPSGHQISTLYLKIDVDHPWWGKPWMKALCWPLLLILLGLIIFRLLHDNYVHRLRVRQTIREKITQKYVSDMNMKFFTNISHEFRTPLTLINGALDLLPEQTDGNESHAFRIIQANANRMLRLVNQLLDFNKLEHDMLRLKTQLLSVSGLVMQIAEMFTDGFQEKSIRFLSSCQGVDGKIWLDADKYEKVTTNLLSNAMKYTPRGGSVLLEVNALTRAEAAAMFPLEEKDQSTRWLLTKVSDTGMGIPKEQLDSIFERYYQLDRNGEKVNGTGIGLCYSKGLVELHHGYIKVEQATEGTGSVFSFILPMDDVYAPEEKVVQEIPESLQMTGTLAEGEPEDEENRQEELPTVLVVDDDTQMLQFLQLLLKDSYRVVTETSATDAITLLPTVKPNLIVSDVMMLGIDGYKFCNLIKNDPSYCHIPVILLTAKSSLEDRIEGLNRGADAYVTKPFEPSYLKALIRNTLGNRRKLQQLLANSTTLEGSNEAPSLIQEADTVFMQKLYDYMSHHLSDAELDLSAMLDLMGMSRSKFYYKIKELTGQTPNALFKTYKLNRAAEMILAGEDKITYIAEITGFASSSHFATNFKKQFGVLPSEYRGTK